MKNSRRIGATFERRIANDLREWLGDDFTITRNEPGYQCGLDGRAGEFHFVGPHAMPLVWECKSEKRFKLSQLFRSPLTGPIETYWQQASEQAASVAIDSPRHPILVCKQSQQPPIAVMRRATSIALCLAGPSPGHIMEIEVNEDDIGRESLRVWRWQDLLSLDSMALMELL